MAEEVKSPMPGKIAKILVNVGDQVTEDDEIVILEAMKMENPIFPASGGVVKEIRVKEGDSVAVDQVLMVIA